MRMDGVPWTYRPVVLFQIEHESQRLYIVKAGEPFVSHGQVLSDTDQRARPGTNVHRYVVEGRRWVCFAVQNIAVGGRVLGGTDAVERAEEIDRGFIQLGCCLDCVVRPENVYGGCKFLAKSIIIRDNSLAFHDVMRGAELLGNLGKNLAVKSAS